MRHVDEYRDPSLALALVEEIKRICTQEWTLMEVCGGQTHSIMEHGIDQLLNGFVELIHGPGCPVCVTPEKQIDHAVELAQRPNVIFTSFGDMMRVPGSCLSLDAVKARGAQVRTVLSPLDAVDLAKANPEKEVVFFAIGFETTAPANALAVEIARMQGITNFSVLVAHVLVPPAMEAILSSSDCRVQGFLAAGHVCVVMGYNEYIPIAARHRVPIVVTGFEPVDILQGVLMCVRQLEVGRADVENQYVRSVTQSGNARAQALMQKVFRVTARQWRGIGEIPQSGLGLCEEYALFDAVRKFRLNASSAGEEETRCIAGTILQGLKKPHDCPLFGKECTPETPVGAPMVSSEGACAAYYRYRNTEGACA